MARNLKLNSKIVAWNLNNNQNTCEHINGELLLFQKQYF